MSDTTKRASRAIAFHNPRNPHGLRFLEGEDGGATAEDTAAPSTGDSAEATGVAAQAAQESATDAGDESALGDPGKKALDAMKAKWKAAEAEAKRLTTEFEAFKAQAEGREAEHAAAIEEQRVKDEALAAANIKIVKANLRAAAAGKLADPTDALTFIDVADFEVDDDGNTDEAALNAAIDDLIKNKPYLAAQGKRFQGDADGGARNESAPTQITRDELSRMTPEQIGQAKKEGRLKDLLGAK